MALQAKDRGIAHVVSGSRVRPAQYDWGMDILAPRSSRSPSAPTS